MKVSKIVPKPIETKKLRVAAYCRVSTDSDEQQNSFETQKAHYEAWIKIHDDWEFAGLFYDFGVTGTKTEHRDGLQNGDTVDSFPPFSTLEEDDPEIADGYEINDDGADSPRVIGKVTGGTETTSEGGSSAEGNDTTVSPSDGSEGNSDGSGASSLAIIAGVTALAGVGGAAYYFTRKRK